MVDPLTPEQVEQWRSNPANDLLGPLFATLDAARARIAELEREHDLATNTMLSDGLIMTQYERSLSEARAEVASHNEIILAQGDTIARMRNEQADMQLEFGAEVERLKDFATTLEDSARKAWESSERNVNAALEERDKANERIAELERLGPRTVAASIVDSQNALIDAYKRERDEARAECERLKRDFDQTWEERDTILRDAERMRPVVEAALLMCHPDPLKRSTVEIVAAVDAYRAGEQL